MAKVTSPFGSQGASGKFGDIVFNRRDSRTAVRCLAIRQKRIPTPAQENVRGRFKDLAAAYQIMKSLTCKYEGVGPTPLETLILTKRPNDSVYREWQHRTILYNADAIDNRERNYRAESGIIRARMRSIGFADNIRSGDLPQTFFDRDSDPAFWIMAMCNICTYNTYRSVNDGIDFRRFSPDGILIPPRNRTTNPTRAFIYETFLRVCWADQLLFTNAIQMRNTITAENLRRAASGGAIFAAETSGKNLSVDYQARGRTRLYSFDVNITERAAATEPYDIQLFSGADTGEGANGLRINYNPTATLATRIIMGGDDRPPESTAIITAPPFNKNIRITVIQITENLGPSVFMDLIRTARETELMMGGYFRTGRSKLHNFRTQTKVFFDDGTQQIEIATTTRDFQGGYNETISFASKSTSADNSFVGIISNIIGLYLRRAPSDNVLNENSTADWREVADA